MEEQAQYNASEIVDPRVDYTIGVLETINFLLSTKNEELLLENIEHAKRIIPTAIEQLKNLRD